MDDQRHAKTRYNSRAVKLAKHLREPLNRVLARWSQVGNDPFLEITPPGLRRLLFDWTDIRDEAVALLGKDDVVRPLAEISADHRRIASRSHWKSFLLAGLWLSDSRSNEALS